MGDDEEANIHDLDEYIACYYEENLDEKIKATGKILRLTLGMENMEDIVTNGMDNNIVLTFEKLK